MQNQKNQNSKSKSKTQNLKTKFQSPINNSKFKTNN